ncbi:transcription elongation factor GreA [Candidatus Berkelbacteria bacterium]|nr:transcription elongation factor GreA [Candidatus Berkelbacteria bacterium]
MQVYQITQEGLEKLKEELRKLKTVDRPQTVKRMAAARELGDLSENADYHDAREQLAFIEGRIEEVESMINRAEVVTRKAGSKTVQIGSRVSVTLNGTKHTYEIVGSNEGDPAQGKLSIESPVGSALLGHSHGETVSVKTPAGMVTYSIDTVA